MGGHGGLNILPQKRWNVYREDNREKVRKDEEAAAKKEQLKREQSRKRDAEFRLEKLRTTRGIPSASTSTTQLSTSGNHINLFEHIKVFPVVEEGEKGSKKRKFGKPEEVKEVKVVSAEDEKFRLGYGIAGKGVKAPWYLAKPPGVVEENEDFKERKEEEGGRKSGKKSLEELREERLKREKREKERERALFVSDKKKNDCRDGGGFLNTRY